MKKQKSLKLNFIMNAILAMSSFIFPLITFPYVSRILLPEGTGKVSFATSLISYFAMLDEFYRIAHKAINFVFLIALPMMLYFMIFAKEGILFLSGDAYENAVLPMQIIMPTIIFIGFR